MYRKALFSVYALALVCAACQKDYKPHRDSIDAFEPVDTRLIADDMDSDRILREAAIGRSYEYQAFVIPVFDGDVCFELSYPDDSPFRVEADHADSVVRFLGSYRIYTNLKVRKKEKVSLSYMVTLTGPLVEKPKENNTYNITMCPDMTYSPEWTYIHTEEYNGPKYDGMPLQRAICGGVSITLTSTPEKWAKHNTTFFILCPPPKE